MHLLPSPLSASSAEAARRHGYKAGSSVGGRRGRHPEGKSRSAKIRDAVRISPPLIIAALFVIAGLCMIAYPFASDYLNKLEQAKVTQDLSRTIEETPKEDLSAYMQQAQDYNERLLAASSYVVDPFDPNAPSASEAEYLGCLNLNGDGVMGQIVIPSINVNLPISHGTEGSNMNSGVGHVTNTSLPVGGSSTHAVLAGHTGLPSAVIFDKLDRLQVGDYFIIQVLGEDHAYKVISTEVVLPDDTSSLGVQAGMDLVTLVTCTPYGINSHRLLVHAERCEVPQDWIDRKNNGDTALPFPYESGSGSFPPFVIGAFIALGILLAAGLVRILKRRRARY